MDQVVISSILLLAVAATTLGPHKLVHGIGTTFLVILLIAYAAGGPYNLNFVP